MRLEIWRMRDAHVDESLSLTRLATSDHTTLPTDRQLFCSLPGVQTGPWVRLLSTVTTSSTASPSTSRSTVILLLVLVLLLLLLRRRPTSVVGIPTWSRSPWASPLRRILSRAPTTRWTWGAAVVEHSSEACCMGLGPAAGMTGCIVAAGFVDIDAVAVADTGSEDTAVE